MRIGLDALAMQSPDHTRRGIGRYARNLVAALADRPGDHQVFLYVHDGLPTDGVVVPPSVLARTIGPDPARGEPTPSARMDRLVRDNPDDLDALLLTCPFEPLHGYLPPAPPRGRPLIASIVYDLIPWASPEIYLNRPGRAAWYDRCLGALRRCDALLAISEATRRECVDRLGVAAHRVANVGAACDDTFSPADPSTARDDADRLNRLGIDRPFVFCVGGADPRKNVRGLVEAFALLPEPMRRGRRLVLTHELFDDHTGPLLKIAGERGVADALVLTGQVDDATLRSLYRRCEVFAFPSLCEGFGLPILEALRCGAAVVAGDNTSQPEVIGGAGLLADAASPRDLSEKIARIWSEPGLGDRLRREAPAQAARFSWDRTAGLVVEALARASEERSRRPPRRPPRARIALLSPFPPAKTGVADYAEGLAAELGRTYVVDRYHAGGYVPGPRRPEEPEAADVRVFDRVAAWKGYRGVVYQMGNSPHHRFLYPRMLRFPGVTTLHDFSLAGFHLGYGASIGRRREHFAEELRHGSPALADAMLARLDALGESSPEPLVAECAALGADLNRRVFERSLRVVVHSPWCVDRLAERHPDLVERAAVIPLGTRARQVSPDRKRAIREEFGLAEETLVLAAFGFVHPDKMNPEILRSFAVVSLEVADAVLLFVGQEADGGEVRREAEALGLMGRVRFLGRRSAEEFADLAAVTDLGVNLRRPPTNGETSAALLDLLRHGVAAIVTDVATFSDYPDAIVRKVRWDEDGQERLTRAVRELASDRSAREALGRAAIEHVRAEHDWAIVADRYVEVIERCRLDGLRAAS